MISKELTPRDALNKAFLKVKAHRTEIEGFKTNLISLLDRTNDTESEEFHKNLVIDFLKKTYYDPNHFINTKGRNDLVIHNGPNANSTVGVIIEAKKPTNKAEMPQAFANHKINKQTGEQKITETKLNSKAFQELVLYYLRERITYKNLEVKHLVATNINEWFIFDATLFDRLFAQNKNLVKQFNDFEEGRLADTKTDFFFKEVAEPFINNITSEIEFTYFNIQDFQKPLRNSDKTDDNSLIALFKLLSPAHLLKLPFTNDSNSLDKRFYSELLHLIGLTETKEGSKKLIERNKAGERHTGTILENAIIQLDSLDKLSRLEKPNQFGNTQQERLFNVALELSITWINRILFLKLLEAQLITYHKGDKSYSFLNITKIKDYDDLNSLFFQVLARKYDERNEDVKKIFEKVPYLNSSLFEPTDIEQVTLFISNLKDDKTIPIFSQTVLKDLQGKKRSGNISTLQYLFEFLDAYDFGAEGGEEIQEDNKTLINASVLGLIFEKINGYNDGSFFTPGFITMYMCRETIRKAVVQKFNENVSKSPLERGFRGVLNPTDINRRQIIPYNPKLKELARELRNNSTKSEIILWKELKGKFEGKYDFHRQKPLDNYIADFFCYELKLVIEIDGETHNWEEVQQKDFQKESRLNELGLNVLRFTDSDIFKHLEATVDTIKQYIIGFEKGDLSEFKYDDTPLNPLSRGDFALPQHTTGKANERPEAFKTLDDVYEQIGDGRLFTRKEANEIVNSIKICDPAVGSGHFLVSALNEMIAVKNDLKILQDRDGKRLKEYQVEVVNDELIVTDEEGELFEYTPPSPLERGERGVSESQRIQETLFHEKQTIIENCLFGVDINPNSVKICRLRLWIELLKNAYYKHLPDPPQGGNTPLSRGVGGVLETLPNIDINIKCGNSLVSRFAIDADLKQALKKSKWTIDSYRIAVDTYRNAESKEQKREMERLIADIKSDFRSEIAKSDPKAKKLYSLKGELLTRATQYKLFEMSKKEKADWNIKVTQLTEETKKLEAEIEEINNNKIFENAFEWRFEFPEVLNDDGDFVGFDVVIGNPPYIGIEDITWDYRRFYESIYKTATGRFDLYSIFIEKAMQIKQPTGVFTYIIPGKFLNNKQFVTARKIVCDNHGVTVVKIDDKVFEDAQVDSVIVENYPATKAKYKAFKITMQELQSLSETEVSSILNDKEIIFRLEINTKFDNLITKIEADTLKVKEIADVKDGIVAGTIKDLLYIDKKKDKDCHKLYFGKHLFKYALTDTDVWVNYKPEEMMKEEVKRKNGKRSGLWMRDEKIFKREKILSRFVAKEIIATYDDDKRYYEHTLHSTHITDKRFKTKFVLGLFNSTLFKFYYRKTNSQGGDIFPQVRISSVENLPIKLADTRTQEKIETLADQILTKKAQDHSADTADLENQIDQLVYQLYDLTEEEIKIIENG